MNLMVEDSGRFVSHCFDTIVALITTDAVAADSMTTASISSLQFHVSVLGAASKLPYCSQWRAEQIFFAVD